MFLFMVKNNKGSGCISSDENYAESILELVVRNWLMGYIEQSEIPII